MTNKKLTVTFAKPKLQNFNDDKKSKSFLQSITTLHGTSHFVNLNWKSKVLWLMMLMCSFMASITFLIIIKNRYNSEQIVTKIFSDWTVDKVPFPSVTICNMNVVSRREAKNIEQILLKKGIPHTEIALFFHDLPYLISFGWRSDTISNHTAVMAALKAHYYSIETIMEEVHQKCENLLLYCEFNSKEKDCKEAFTLIPTTEGFCCSFNFGGLGNDQTEEKILDDEFEYYYDQGTDDPGITKTNMIATSQAGRSSGLRVVFDVEPNDYILGPFNMAYGARILINDPNDYIETRFSYKYMAIGESVGLKVEPRIFQSEDSLRGVDPAKRGCWFFDEVELMHTSRYSFETCNTECRSNSYLEFCGCVPYKYPPDKTHRTCEFTDLTCLYYMKGNWERTRKRCKPECYKECRDKDYQVTNDIVPFLADSYPGKVTQGRNVSELAGLHVYYLKSTCNCYMMILLTDTNTFIATYGGIFSLSFGASIITVFELLYLSLSYTLKAIQRFTCFKKPTKVKK